MHPRLVLDTPRPAMTRKRIFERVFDTSGSLPPRKKIKRESSKAADDSAERAAEEKLMLMGDLKHDRDFQPRSFSSPIRLTLDFPCFLIRKSTKSEKRRRKNRNRRMSSARCRICPTWPMETASSRQSPSTRFKPKRNKYKLVYHRCQMVLPLARIPLNSRNTPRNKMLSHRRKHLKR